MEHFYSFFLEKDGVSEERLKVEMLFFQLFDLLFYIPVRIFILVYFCYQAYKYQKH